MKATIAFSDFSKLDLRVGDIVSAEPVTGTDTLLRLEVDLGEMGRRQLVAGLVKAYLPQDLVNKQIVVVVNLQAKVIRGVQSEGMLLAATCEERPVLLVPEREVPAGSAIR